MKAYSSLNAMIVIRMWRLLLRDKSLGLAKLNVRPQCGWVVSIVSPYKVEYKDAFCNVELSFLLK